MSLGFFRAIKGHFVLEKFKPDGDSLRFVPQEPERFRGLYREHMSLATDGGYQLRLEGIDAPETHYGAARQPQGDEARDHLLELLGITGVTREEQLITGCKPPRLPGTILTASFDPHGRPISYALLEADATELRDGQELKVEAELLSRTLNARMLQDGFAYPLLYTSTPVVHQDYLRGAAKSAQAKGLQRRPAPADGVADLPQVLPSQRRLPAPPVDEPVRRRLPAVAGADAARERSRAARQDGDLAEPDVPAAEQPHPVPGRPAQPDLHREVAWAPTGRRCQVGKK
jgi:hypothetical protein